VPVSESFPWTAGVATGVGSMPGEDPREALRVVLGELPDLPHLPELPARGPGADLVGRGAGVLVDMHVDLQPSGWRFVDRPGRDVRRARDLLERDLDALEELAADYSGPLKVQLAGPWTLAASVELTRGDKALADPGACRDLAQSLAEGTAAHVAAVRRRVPGARVVVQVDEPSLPAVLDGRVPTASGYGRLPAVERPVAEAALAEVLAAGTRAGAEATAAHCCAAGAPVDLLRAAGAHAVLLDAGLLTERDDEALGEAVEAGLALGLGLVPSTDPAAPPDPRRLADPARRLWNRLGFAPEQLADRILVTPSCGTAGASPRWATSALRLAREVGRILAEAPESGPATG
jgi:methionine synthase II (cobalamin-independent)